MQNRTFTVRDGGINNLHDTVFGLFNNQFTEDEQN